MVKAADMGGFNAGNIIDDHVFFNSTTMTETQIQDFLNTKVSTCQNGYVCLKDFRQDTGSKPADRYCKAYGGALQESAARIIAKVSAACGINPQVLIVMLQKEQALITHSWPSAWRYDAAMGQGCPDDADCDADFKGFFNQVYGAARQMQIYSVSSYFTWYAPGHTWSVRYSPDASCGSGPVYIENQATANLYYYTPYQPTKSALAAGYGASSDPCASYGNRNFYQYFADWFGPPTGYSVKGGVLAAYEREGGANGVLGAPNSPEICGLLQDGCFQLFLGGQIHWTAATGGHATHGAILTAWAADGYERGALGYPLSDESCGLARSGCYQVFQNGQIHWTAKTGAHATRAEIGDAWAKQNWENGKLGYPVSEQSCGLKGGGCFQYFEGGQIHWTKATGAHITSGKMKDAWGRLGWENGRLGYPTTDEICKDGVCSQSFQGGTLVVDAKGRLSIVWGGINAAWVAAGGMTGALGAPTLTSEQCGLKDGGCFQYFQKGQIHWSPAGGAHATSGAMKDAWGRLGWENGVLGYPVTDQICVDGTCAQSFQGGSLVIDGKGVVSLVSGGIGGAWAASGGLKGTLGAPTFTAEQCGLKDGGCFQYFQKGQIHWSPASGPHVTLGKVKDAWGAAGWEDGKLGYPVGELTCGLKNEGCYQSFQGGSVHYSKSTPAVPTWGGIGATWAAQGWENGKLGYPLAPEVCTSASSCTQKFQGGTLAWTATGGVVVKP